MRARRVVTLPPGLRGNAAAAFASRVRSRGAELLELRTDLHDVTLDAQPLARVLPLLVAERGAPAPAEWLPCAMMLDRERDGAGAREAGLVSFHAAAPLDPEAALAAWLRFAPPPEAHLKHVEPLGAPQAGGRLLELQARLGRSFGSQRVTVLATGALALPFRSLLAERNALDYLAAGPDWAAAPGQRLLDDAVRAGRAPPGTLRLGIIGSDIAGSRSPRLHRQPFDRIDLPRGADLAGLLAALRDRYAGLAVTSPFKQEAARLTGARLEAVNTLVQGGDGWRGESTDEDGAAAVLESLGRGPVTVLGAGGVRPALVRAAGGLGVPLTFVRRAEVGPAPLSGRCVWTWPPGVDAGSLRFVSAEVAVIAYGEAGRSIAAEIARRGGTPLRLGPRWLVAQARRQRALFDAALAGEES